MSAELYFTLNGVHKVLHLGDHLRFTDADIVVTNLGGVASVSVGDGLRQRSVVGEYDTVKAACAAGIGAWRRIQAAEPSPSPL